MSIPGKIWLTLLVLAILIFVHELGHFLAAKLFRVKVLRFSLGFGPKLLGFRWGETEYLLSALILGGYVKMAGDDPSEETAPEDKGRGFLEQPPWKRALIALAGPAMNLAFPVLIYFVVFSFQSAELSSRLGQVEPDCPAWAAGLRQGDRIVAVNGEPVHYFGELSELIGPKWERPVHLTYERLGEVRTVDVVPEKVETRGVLETEVRGIIGVRALASAPVVGVASPSSPVAKAGLRSFDRVVQVNGAKVATFSQLEASLAREASAHRTALLKVVRDVPGGGPAGALTTYSTFDAELDPSPAEGPFALKALGLEPADLYVFQVEKGSPAEAAGMKRGDRLLEAGGQKLGGWTSFDRIRQQVAQGPLTVVFARDGERFERTVQQRVVAGKDEFDNPQPERLLFGADNDRRLSSFAEGELIPYKIGVGKALAKALKLVPDDIREVLLVIRRLVEGRVSFRSVGGPLMVGDVASRAAEQGWEAFLSVLALISVNLGVMNLLPVPILDGFHILSAALEGIPPTAHRPQGPAHRQLHRARAAVDPDGVRAQQRVQALHRAVLRLKRPRRLRPSATATGSRRERPVALRSPPARRAPPLGR